MRIFALEYIRKILNSDEIHFVVAKKKAQFRIKTQVGPFVCNTKTAGEAADKILKEMKFSLGFTWSYNPYGIISKLRVDNKNTPYIHTSRPEIEQYVNLLDWAENTLQDAEEQLVSTSSLQTPVPQKKSSKRQREEVSSSTTGNEAREFRISYRKRPKVTHKPKVDKEMEE